MILEYFLRAYDPPRSLFWKSSFTGPACIISGKLTRLPHEVTTILTVAGVAASVWFWWRERQQKALRKRAEESLERFSATTELSLDAIAQMEAIRDTNGQIVDFRIQYVNPASARLMGRSREEIEGKTLCEIRPDIKNSGPYEHYRSVVESGTSADVEYPAPVGNTLKCTWLRYRIVKLGDGVAVTCSDISTTKEAQIRYEHLVKFNRSIFQDAPFSITSVNLDGTITAMNLAAEKLTGYSSEELVGKAPLTLLHDERELTAAAQEAAGPDDTVFMSGFEVLVDGVAAGAMAEKEWTLVRKDGSRTRVNLAVRAINSDTGEISGYVGIAFDIMDRLQMLEYVTHLATHDQLTGLAGRALLRDKAAEAVERARRYGTKVAVFMIDLDQFKRINDSLGHSSGDQVLIETASRLRRSVRSTDIVARVGGDEFVVVMSDMTSIADVESCAANLITKMAPEIRVEGQLVNITTSVGVCIYPDFAADARHLLKRADSAMYVAKENGRNQYQIFSEDMLKETADRLSIEHALRHALDNNELSLHFQPQFSLSTGLVTGAEALLRWNHPKLGNIPPGQFIPLAEETGLILPIGEWVFMTACREGKALQDELGIDLTISVNLSPRQLLQRDLVQMIEHALAVSGLPARHLEIEITENMLMVNSTANLEKLQQIRELGTRISIDDFGTGFSSFSYLLQYHVDRLKIDRSFVKQAITDPNAAAVVRTIIAMSHGLAIRVVAEGVENEEELRFLARRKCDEAQGNYLGYPVPVADFAAVIKGCSSINVLQNI